MTDQTTLDWRRDLLVRALYGELSEDEQRQFEMLLDTDRALRDEYDELKAARSALAELAEDEPLPRDVEPLRLPVPVRWPRMLLSAAAGFAVAASVFLALLVSGLRIDRIDGGLLVSLSPEPVEVAEPIELEVVTRAEFDAFAQALVEHTGARLTELEQRQTGAQLEVAQALYDALAMQQQQQYIDLRARLDQAVYASWQSAGR